MEWRLGHRTAVEADHPSSFEDSLRWAQEMKVISIPINWSVIYITSGIVFVLLLLWILFAPSSSVTTHNLLGAIDAPDNILSADKGQMVE